MKQIPWKEHEANGIKYAVLPSPFYSDIYLLRTLWPRTKGEGYSFVENFVVAPNETTLHEYWKGIIARESEIK